MRRNTNELVSRAKKFGAPVATAAVAVMAAGLLMQHNGVHAASGAASAPLDDSSVSSLVSLDNAMEAVASRVTPAVVNVSVTSRGGEREAADEDGQEQGMQGLPPGFSQFFGQGGGQGGPGQGGTRRGQPQEQPLQRGIGSGIIISPDGYIVTNNHVVDGAVQMKVTLNDRRVLTAKLIGADKMTDLAVIKVNATGLPSIPWGDSTKLHAGQTVLAFGSPFGYLQFSVTRGIVSALNRPDPYSTDARKVGAFIQTDAAINPGNSGGPLVDAHGELIGINTSIITSSGSFAGAGFAIPSQIARATTEQLIKTGSVHHGYLGISMNDVTPDNAHFFNLPDASGAIVAQVSPDSPASRAGVQSGDVIVALNGNKVLNGSALQVAVSQNAPGSRLSLGVLREGKQQTLNVTVGEFHSNTEVASEDGSTGGPKSGKLGLAVSDLTPDVRQQLQLPTQVKGVAVESVRPASPAEDAGIAPGDVILEVDRQPTSSAEQFVGQVHASPAGKDLLLLVWSKGNASYRLLRQEPEKQNGM